MLKRVLIGLIACLATLAIAETDYLALPRIKAIANGEETVPLLSATAATVGTLSATSATISGTLTADSMFAVYSGVGSTNVQLTTVTPLAKGQIAYSAANVVVALTGAGTTGTVAIAKGSTTNDWILLQ